jgi:hypothetical protein
MIFYNVDEIVILFSYLIFIMFSVITVLFVVLPLFVFIECKTHPFYCDFKLNSLCGMQNGNPVDPTPPTINFTIRTSETITYPDLGPSTNQPFLYWSRSDHPSQAELINGQIHTARFNQSEKMCVQFSYYLKSTGIHNNTWFDISTGGCYGASLYFIEQDNTDNWQIITVPLHRYTCPISLSITVNQREPARMAIAFDYIIVDLCDDFDPSNNGSKQTLNILFLVIISIFILFVE